MAFVVDILVRNADQVFNWISQNVPQDLLVRQLAREVSYSAWKSGAILSTGPHPDVPDDSGEVAKIFVKDLATAQAIATAWTPKVDRCDVWEITLSTEGGRQRPFHRLVSTTRETRGT